MDDDTIDPSRGGDVPPVAVRDVRPCEQEQARLFATILSRELRDMRRTAASAEKQLLQRTVMDRKTESSERLERLRGRIAEAERILKALDARFYSAT
ncbi:MAG: hypothetical protein QOG79_4969 [Mycobacterium sp.]|nr:hypothetical protein [Mycobacterium sp.]MDT5265902.1 hypothetical protein [Mycobacterium sp.]MDT5301727.1 hypothetical protein [Mycobacterium sp.]